MNTDEWDEWTDCSLCRCKPCVCGVPKSPPTPTIASQAAEIAALRQALRAYAISTGKFNRNCHLCGMCWSRFDTSERHESGCLAATGEGSKP